MKTNLAAFFSGVLFAVGLGVAGMTRPEKVIGFLDVANWDPALMFVMGGAMTTYMVLLPLVKKRTGPVLSDMFRIPTRRDITPRLVAGSAMFGVGWGLAGFCPGPGLVSLATAAPTAFAFVASMTVGMLAFRTFDRWLAARHHAAETAAAAETATNDTLSRTAAQPATVRS